MSQVLAASGPDFAWPTSTPLPVQLSSRCAPGWGVKPTVITPAHSWIDLVAWRKYTLRTARCAAPIEWRTFQDSKSRKQSGRANPQKLRLFCDISLPCFLWCHTSSLSFFTSSLGARQQGVRRSPLSNNIWKWRNLTATRKGREWPDSKCFYTSWNSSFISGKYHLSEWSGHFSIWHTYYHVHKR